MVKRSLCNESRCRESQIEVDYCGFHPPLYLKKSRFSMGWHADLETVICPVDVGLKGLEIHD